MSQINEIIKEFNKLDRMMTNLIGWNDRCIQLTKDIDVILPSIKNSLERISILSEESPRHEEFEEVYFVLKKRLNGLIKDNSDVEKTLNHIDSIIGDVKQVIASLREEKY